MLHIKGSQSSMCIILGGGGDGGIQRHIYEYSFKLNIQHQDNKSLLKANCLSKNILFVTSENAHQMYTFKKKKKQSHPH